MFAFCKVCASVPQVVKFVLMVVVGVTLLPNMSQHDDSSLYKNKQNNDHDEEVTIVRRKTKEKIIRLIRKEVTFINEWE
jgi:hypothetical protein